MPKKIRFKVDYRGVLTAERYFRAGDEETFDDRIAEALVKEDRASYVEKPIKRAKTKSKK